MARTRVFVVEDQPALLRSLVKLLQTFSELDVVGSALDAERALEMIPALHPDLVLVDLELPGMDGLELTRRLKRGTAPLEVLILTSFDDEQRVFDAMREGASGYLVKRAGGERLRAAIQEIVAGGTVLEPQIARRFWNLFQAVRTQAPGGAPADPFGLTEVEREVLQLVAKGLSNAEVGRTLAMERRAVRTQLGHIYKKLGVNSHVEAVVAAIRAGLVEL